MELFDSPSLTRLDLALKSMGQQSVERRRTGFRHNAATTAHAASTMLGDDRHPFLHVLHRRLPRDRVGVQTPDAQSPHYGTFVLHPSMKKVEFLFRIQHPYSQRSQVTLE